MQPPCDSSPTTTVSFRRSHATCRHYRALADTRPVRSLRSHSINARPILEANTIRLLSRLIAYRGNPHSTAGQRLLWQVAEEILPHKQVARFNQALMELGSLVCTPAEPQCGECPLSEMCGANAVGLQREIPLAKPRPEVMELREAAVVVRKKNAVLVRHCGQRERWAGLWDFPRFGIEASGPLFAAKEIMEKVAAQTGIQCAPGSLLKTIKHGVTRYRITLDCYEATYVAGRAKKSQPLEARWVSVSHLASIPLSTTGRKIARLIES